MLQNMLQFFMLADFLWFCAAFFGAEEETFELYFPQFCRNPYRTGSFVCVLGGGERNWLLHPCNCEVRNHIVT